MIKLVGMITLISDLARNPSKKCRISWMGKNIVMVFFLSNGQVFRLMNVEDGVFEMELVEELAGLNITQLVHHREYYDDSVLLLIDGQVYVYNHTDVTASEAYFFLNNKEGLHSLGLQYHVDKMIVNFGPIRVGSELYLVSGNNLHEVGMGDHVRSLGGYEVKDLYRSLGVHLLCKDNRLVIGMFTEDGFREYKSHENVKSFSSISTSNYTYLDNDRVLRFHDEFSSVMSEMTDIDVEYFCRGYYRYPQDSEFLVVKVGSTREFQLLHVNPAQLTVKYSIVSDSDAEIVNIFHDNESRSFIVQTSVNVLIVKDGQITWQDKFGGSLTKSARM